MRIRALQLIIEKDLFEISIFQVGRGIACYPWNLFHLSVGEDYMSNGRYDNIIFDLFGHRWSKRLGKHATA